MAASAQLRSLSHAIQGYLDPDQPLPADFTYGSWEVAFTEIAQLADTQRLVVVLDEFAHPIETEPVLPSIPRQLWCYRITAPPSAPTSNRGLTQQTWQNTRKHMPEFVGTYIFEELCREWVLRQGDVGHLPFVPRRVGSFWGSGKPQIDVVAVNEDDHAILLGECKWTADPIRKRAVESFLTRAQQVVPSPANPWQGTYAMFSRSGFTDEARRAATGYACLWLSLDEIDTDLHAPFAQVPECLAPQSRLTTPHSHPAYGV